MKIDNRRRTSDQSPRRRAGASRSSPSRASTRPSSCSASTSAGYTSDKHSLSVGTHFRNVEHIEAKLQPILPSRRKKGHSQRLEISSVRKLDLTAEIAIFNRYSSILQVCRGASVTRPHAFDCLAATKTQSLETFATRHHVLKWNPLQRKQILKLRTWAVLHVCYVLCVV